LYLLKLPAGEIVIPLPPSYLDGVENYLAKEIKNAPRFKES